jgi:hypothetical protein
LLEAIQLPAAAAIWTRRLRTSLRFRRQSISYALDPKSKLGCHNRQRIIGA